MISNRTIAISGIGVYILSIIASATDMKGNPTVPDVLIATSGIAMVAFYILATLRLWKYAKYGVILFVASCLVRFSLETIQVITPFSNGSPVIVLLSIFKIITLATFIWAVIKLFTMGDDKLADQQDKM